MWRRWQEKQKQKLVLHLFFCVLILFIFSGFLILPVVGYTELHDVYALNAMYSSLNKDPRLTGWRDSGGDPCVEAWLGIICSGTRVTEINLPGLGLTGNLEGFYLERMISLTTLDFSNNNIGPNKALPYSFPPNLLHLDLSYNSYSIGALTWSLTKMSSLQSLRISNNQLRGELDDLFGNFYSLSTIDLSGNFFSGNLPTSFEKLINLNFLHLQNNQFTGTVDVLSNLPFDDLNIANNQFTGEIPEQFKTIQSLQVDGNSWDRIESESVPENSKRVKSDLGIGALIGIVIAALSIVSLAAAVMIFTVKNRDVSTPKKVRDTTKRPSSSSFPQVVSNRKISISSFADSNLQVTEKTPILYTLSDLQVATRSFDEENFLGDGCIGGVYRAEFEVDGSMTMAVKNVNSSVLSNETSGDFMEVVKNISMFRNPNVSELVGYCSEHGQHLLVYDFHRNGSLYDLLYLSRSDDETKPVLTWETRMEITLGTAKAFEYLHELCSPSVMHRNVKSSNILLDEDLNPLLGDCGLADLVTNVKDQTLAEHVGSGYCAPEVSESGYYTVKSDVFSFGVVMLELLTGRKPFDCSRPRSEQSLVRWATPQLHDFDALDKMVDPSLKGIYSPKSLSRFADAIALCVQKEPEFRPPMSDVVQTLSRLIQQANGSKRKMACVVDADDMV